MTRGHGKKKQEFLSPSEVQSLRDEKQELQATLNELQNGAGSGTSGSGINIAGIKGEMARIDKAIEERTPEKPSSITKDRLEKEEKALEERIAEGMPTRDEMARPTKNPGAVRKHMEWCKRNQASIERYVQIQRTLRPMEPKSIDVLRREK